MTQPQKAMLQCSNCGNPNPVELRTVIDAQKDPAGKNLLINGRMNTFRCQQCGTQNSISSPLLYHDANNELLIALVPMDVAARQKVSEEKIIGDLMNELTNSLPKDAFRAYMFNPKRALTMQGLIEQVIEAEGITKEMIEEQKKRVELIQKFVDAGSEQALIAIIKKYDDEIDISTFQTLSMMGQRVIQEGQQQLAGHLMMIQQRMLDHSTFGQEIAKQQKQQDEAIQVVGKKLETLSEDASRADLVNIAIEVGADDMQLQALVGLARTALDYEFFLEFSDRIDKASTDERDKLESIRDKMRELTEVIDSQTRAIVQEKTDFLRTLIESDQYEEMLEQNLEELDDNFMGVLAANIQEAKRRNDTATLDKMTKVYDKAVSLLQSQMTEELRFVNDLLSAPNPEALQKLIDERADEFEDLLDVVDAVEELFEAQGQAEGIKRLAIIREALQKSLS